MHNEDQVKAIAFVLKVCVLVFAVKGCGLEYQEIKAPPRIATIVNVENGNISTKLDLDWDDDIETVERTIYLTADRFKGVAKPGDKILYKEKINRRGQFSKHIPSGHIWKIGDVVFKEQAEKQK